MTVWWRAHSEALHDPKLQRVGGDEFKMWFNLMCLACIHDGLLPPIGDIAFALRMTEQRAAVALAGLVARGLFDRKGERYEPHNWNGRQYKSDVSTARVKQFRKRKGNVSSNVSETAPESEQNRTDDADGGARASPGESLISPEAYTLATEVAVIAGFPTIDDWPPGWCGAPMHAQKWIAQGWDIGLIRLAVTGAMAKKRDGPPSSITYFEKPIAQAHAQLSAPLPVVIASSEPEKIHAAAQRYPARNPGNSVVAAALQMRSDLLEREDSDPVQRLSKG